MILLDHVINRNLILLGIISASLLIATSMTASSLAAQPTGQAGENKQQQGQGNSIMQGASQNDERPSVQYQLNKKYHDYKDGVFMVRAGGGSKVAPLTLFFPNHAEIKVGEKVVFYNPTKVGEPHTVTFTIDNSTFADFVAPFIIGNKTSITSAVPNANAEPIIMPGQNGTNLIIALNIRSMMPTVIDSTGKVTYLPPNANYTFTGTEKYVNSGWIWPKGQSPQGLPPIDSFTVTFSKAGTYNYYCQVHPWMNGDVVVK
jgi:plastocyanin